VDDEDWPASDSSMMPGMTSVLRSPRSRPASSQAPEPRAQAPVSPPATRPARRRWRDPRLVVGVALVALAVVLGARLAGGGGTVSVWRARVPLAAGHRLVPADLVRTDLRFSSQQDADRYLSAGTPPAAGLVLARDVGAGELLPRAALAGRAPERLTEVPLSVGTDAVPATVGVGSVVDVWVAPDRDTAAAPASEAAQADLVFDDVVVVAASHGGSSLGPSTTRQVIVGLPPDQVDDLPTALAALGRGSVVLTRQD
jgi:hypothetical protein